MKKILLISLVLIGIASLASATPVQCSVLMSPNNGGGSSSTLCTVTAAAGFYISSLTLTGTDDYTGFGSGNPVVSFSGTLTSSAVLTVPLGAPTFCNVVTSGTNSTPCSILPNPNPASNSNTAITTFTLQLTNAGDTVAGGVVTGASIVLNLDYGTTLIPVTGTPEPTTLGLMGGALLGLGLLARRKK